MPYLYIFLLLMSGGIRFLILLPARINEADKSVIGDFNFIFNLAIPNYEKENPMFME